MNKLTIINKNGQLLADSREVALMVEKEHKNLLRDIKGYAKVLDGSNMSGHDFFIPSLYINSQNKEQPCYLLTKKGCEMVANKMTGIKGVLFTATYVTKFAEMEEHIKKQQTIPIQTGLEPQVFQLAQGMQLIGQVVQGMQTVMNNMQTYVQDSIQAKDHQIDQTMDMIGLRSKNTMVLTELLKDKLYQLTGDYVNANSNLYKRAKYRVFKEYKVSRWEDIPVGRFNSIYAFIDTLEKDDISIY